MPKRDVAWMRAEAARERAAALQAISRAELWDRTADELERLTGSEQERRLTSMFTDPVAHAVASSRGKAPKDPLLVLAREAKPTPFTLRSLAKAVGMSPAALSMARNGTKQIRRAKADEIAKLTGFAATAKHWPGGILD